MTTKSETSLGRTKLIYNEAGQLIAQSLPEGAWQQGPTLPIPTRPPKPAPTPLATILSSVETIERELHEATAAYEASLAPGKADPYQAEKCDLLLRIQALRKQLEPLEARLKELQSLPAPAVQFKNSIARLEQQTNGAAMQLTNTLAHAKALELHDQDLESLPRDTQKLVLNRRDVSGATDVASPGFCRFGRTPEEVRTSDQAKTTVGAAHILCAQAVPHTSRQERREGDRSGDEHED